MAGSNFPLLFSYFSEFYLRDGLAGIAERHPDLNINPNESSVSSSWFQSKNQSGAELVLDILRSRPSRSITYLALGPLTNLAATLRLDSTLVRDRLGLVVCMGGALDVPGNTSPVAECACRPSFY